MNMQTEQTADGETATVSNTYLHRIYRHKKSGNTYFTRQYCEMKCNGEWVIAMSYSSEGGDDLYVRSLESFEKKFKLVTE